MLQDPLRGLLHRVTLLGGLVFANTEYLFFGELACVLEALCGDFCIDTGLVRLESCILCRILLGSKSRNSMILLFCI